MAYGIVKQWLRIPESDVVYWRRGSSQSRGYVFVPGGFFSLRNILLPLPLGLLLGAGHVLYIIGILRVLNQRLWISWMTNFWYGTWGGLSVTAGSHRLWCHRSFKARLPLRIFLMLGQTMTGQYDAHSWAVGHRIHHKYSDTDADPHNTKRGFLFSHIGWIFRTEHPDVANKEKSLVSACEEEDIMKDLDSDPVLLFQRTHYVLLYILTSVVIPVSLQLLLAGDTLLDAFLLAIVMRNLSVYHDTMFVNSAAHMFGDRPYNDAIAPSDNYAVSLASFGEGYHNYHHSFPWDYKAGESATASSSLIGRRLANFNLTTLFIDAMWCCGQAYGLREASHEIVSGSRMRTAANKNKNKKKKHHHDDVVQQQDDYHEENHKDSREFTGSTTTTTTNIDDYRRKVISCNTAQHDSSPSLL